MSKKRILVTGGAGFIGSHIVDRYSQDHEVMVVDDLRTGFLENLSVSTRVPVVRASLGSLEATRAIETFAPHIVSHMAAQLEISKGYDDPISEIDQDLAAVVELLETCRGIGSVEQFVFASSACVYSPVGSRRLLPEWTYGAAKLAAEHYVRIYRRYFATTSLRLGIVFGPREWYGRVLTNFAKRVADGDPMVLFGRGQATRDFTYVRDVADIHRRVTDTRFHGSWDVGSGTEISIRNLAEIITEATGTGWEREDVDEGMMSAEMPGRMRLPNEMQRMNLKPGDLATRTITDDGLLEEYLKYARSKPTQWAGERYRV